MVVVADLVNAMEIIAPLGAAEPWDNVGLLIGDSSAALRAVLLTIDYTSAVAAESEKLGCDAVIAYHPPLFKPIQRLTVAGSTGLLFNAARRGVALYSPHTALDAAEGGTNDVLSDLLDLHDRKPLRPRTGRDDLLKFVTFTPPPHAERVAAAVFAAGAGGIGNYDSCGFRTDGTGSFRGGPDTNPTIGKPGILTMTAEVKLETIVPAMRAADVVAALRATHPYEDPAFDFTQLAAVPSTGGMGRVGRTTTGTTRSILIERVKRQLGLAALWVAGSIEGPADKVAVCAGSGGELLDAALACNAQVFVTGEMRHHDALRATAAGVMVICTLHSHSERVTLPRLRDRLTTALPAVDFRVSQADRDPFALA